MRTHLPCCSFSNTSQTTSNCTTRKGISNSSKFFVTELIFKRHLCVISNSERSCWNCNKKIGNEKFFCKLCKIIQPPLGEMSFFGIFDSPETYDVDVKLLTENYRKLQSMLHPDKFGNSNDEEQQYSAEQSSLINKAYNTLLDPLSRALYMLELRDVLIGEENTVQDPEFLMEIMEINEMLSEVKSLKDLDGIREKNNASMDECILGISSSLAEDNLEMAKGSVIKLRYYRNILEIVQHKTLELE